MNFIDHFCERLFEKHFDNIATDEGRGTRYLNIRLITLLKSNFFFGWVPSSKRKLTLLVVLHLLGDDGTVAAFYDFPSDSYVANLTIHNFIPKRTLSLSILTSSVEPRIVVLYLITSCRLDQQQLEIPVLTEKVSSVRNNIFTFFFNVDLFPVLKSDHLRFWEDELSEFNFLIFEGLLETWPFFWVAWTLLILIEGVLVYHRITKFLMVSVLGLSFSITVLLSVRSFDPLTNLNNPSHLDSIFFRNVESFVSDW